MADETYRKVYIKMWRYGSSFTKLSPLAPSGQALWLYLLTGDLTTPIPGVINAGRGAVSEALGWDMKAFNKAFQEVFNEGLVKANWKRV